MADISLNYKLKIFFVIPALAFLTLSPAFGQQDTLPPSPLVPDAVTKNQKNVIADSSTLFDKIVVTGTRTRRSIKDNPGSISVITREKIESSAHNNVSDLLQYEPGVVVKRPVGMGEGVPSDIVIRGVPGATAAARTLILVDGIPTNAAGTPFLILNEVPMDAVEQVEVVRGPYSNLYGPNAFGGVVNIITKKPSQGVHGGISGAGYVNFYDVNTDINGTAGRFSFLADGTIRGTPNYYLLDSVPHRFGNYTRMSSADNYGYYEKRYFGKYSYAITPRVTLTLHTRYFESELGTGITEYGNPPTNITIRGQKYLVGPVIKATITPAWDVTAGGYFRNLTGIYNNWGILRTDTIHKPVPAPDSIFDVLTDGVWKSSSNDWQINLLSTLKLGRYNTVLAGFDFLDNAIDFGPRRDQVTGVLLKNAYGVKKDMVNTGLFVQDELNLGDRLITVAGLRLDYNSVFGIVPSPRLGSLYKLTPQFLIKASAGRAFRAPSLTELNMPDLPINTNTTVHSEPTLRPEYIWSVDGGPEIEVTKWLSLKFTGFYNYMNDLITQKIINEYFQNIEKDTKLSHRNTETAWSAGLENSLVLRLFNWGNFFLNYSYTASRDLQMDGALEYIPEHQFSAGIFGKKSFGPFTIKGSVLGNFVGDRQYLDWRLSWDLIQAGEMPIPSPISDFRPSYMTLHSYFRLDASAKIFFKDFIWLGIEGMNLTNEEIEEVFGTFAPKRFVWVKIGVKF
jgi:outer membrane receptor protein involved in Fe transport